MWRDRLQDRDKYQRTFSGRELVSQSLPGAQEFRKVLSRLNEEFMHPNPDFAYRDMTVQNEGQAVLVRIELFDKPAAIHEAHLLAYLNWLDRIRQSSNALVGNILAPPVQGMQPCPIYGEVNRDRATDLAKREPLARRILEELGLWQLSD